MQICHFNYGFCNLIPPIHSVGTYSRRAIWRRVDNTEHTQPILFYVCSGFLNDGIHAKDIEVCLWLLFNVFRVYTCL